ncbi:MAG: hypothetical protein HY924_09960 [Elusimicrobia bacterium]|nr:hypothetical protein [Elusimicrobiota bacterium]
MERAEAEATAELWDLCRRETDVLEACEGSGLVSFVEAEADDGAEQGADSEAAAFVASRLEISGLDQMPWLCEPDQEDSSLSRARSRNR